MTDAATALSPVVRRFVEDAGNMTSSLGLGRAIGQIFAYLYFSSEPRSLADMQAALGISKGGASMSVRQLEQWGAVRKVWVKGDRKDYYEANDWLGRIVRNVIADVVARKLLASGNAMLNGPEDVDVPQGSDSNSVFVRERIELLRKFRQKAQRMWANPLVQRLLK